MKMYIVKTKIGTEDKVIADMTARLEGAGSMKEKKAYIGKMINPAHLKGYLFVEAIDEHYLDISGMDRFFGCMKWAHELRRRIIKNTAPPTLMPSSSDSKYLKIACAPIE